MTKKVFMSYSRSNPHHVERIVRTATILTEDHGIDVILDLWACKPGQDLNAFMESMVNDDTIDYVLIMSDNLYATKADSKVGGVGTESTIISTEVYGNVLNTKFIPIYMDLNDGKPSLPIFCKSRNAIGMTTEENDYESIEEIARWINEQPIYIKPKLGTVPDYNSNSTSLKKDEQRLFLSKSYSLEENLLSLLNTIKKELLSLEESSLVINDDVILKIKPYIESIKKIYNFMLETDFDVSYYLSRFYNDLLKEIKNEYDRPLLILFNYFSFLDLISDSFTRNDTSTIRTLLMSDYVWINRKCTFTILSLYPMSLSENPFFQKEGYQTNIRRYCANVLFDDLRRERVEDVDVILNTVSSVNPIFQEDWRKWHGTLLYLNIFEEYEYRSRQHYLIERFRFKDFFDRYKFIFGCSREELISKINEFSKDRREIPNINRFINITEIGKY